MPATKRAKEEEKMEEITEEKDRMTVYIKKPIAKRFKIYAIEIEKDFSQLAEQAFIEFLEKYKKTKL